MDYDLLDYDLVDYNLNLVIIGGQLAAPPELRTAESGSRLVRYLVTVRSDEPTRRVDVLPVTKWDPDPDLLRRHCHGVTSSRGPRATTTSCGAV